MQTSKTLIKRVKEDIIKIDETTLFTETQKIVLLRNVLMKAVEDIEIDVFATSDLAKNN
jgi:hypothetical protein